ncbi:MAG: hypothetical protein WAV30_03820 [Microgenomates group bacterium]
MNLSKELTTVTPFSKALALTLFIVLPIVAFSLGMSYQATIEPKTPPTQNVIPSDEPVACTMDAKICPDGTAVGRIGPDCEFEECPVIKGEVKKFTGTISNIDYSCQVDGICSIGVGKASVIVQTGETMGIPQPRGTFPTAMLDDTKLNDFVRKQVEVYAQSVDGRTDSYTLYGDKSYYIKIIDDVQERCGGIAGKMCQTGYYCKYDGTYPDAAGTCVKSMPSKTGYSCPEGDYVDCMPGPNQAKKTECSSAFLQWATENCPGFQGAAY